MAGSFGLLHGFGFASVLNEIGLPQIEVPAALLFFNVGVEVGQILFIVLLVMTATALTGLGVIGKNDRVAGEIFVPARVVRPAAYLVVTLAAYWLFDRVAGFLA